MSHQPGSERRVFTRIPLQAEVKLINTTGKWTCELIDLSLSGILAKLPEKWNASLGEPFLIELLVKDDNLKIHMNGTLVRLDGNKIGFKTQHIGESSIVNLVKIVKNNIGDSELLNRELSVLFG